MGSDSIVNDVECTWHCITLVWGGILRLLISSLLTDIAIIVEIFYALYISN